MKGKGKLKEAANIKAADQEKLDSQYTGGAEGERSKKGKEKFVDEAHVKAKNYKKRTSLLDAFKAEDLESNQEEEKGEQASSREAREKPLVQELGARSANLITVTSNRDAGFYKEGDVTPSMLADAVNSVKIALTTCAARLTQELRQHSSFALLHSTPRSSDKSGMELQMASTSSLSMDGSLINSQLKRAWEYQLVECFFSAFDIPPSTQGDDGAAQKAEDTRRQLLEEYKSYRNMDTMRLFNNNPTFTSLIQGWAEKLANSEGLDCELNLTSAALFKGSCGCGPRHSSGCGCEQWPHSSMSVVQLSSKPSFMDSTSANLHSATPSSDVKTLFNDRADRKKFISDTLDEGKAKPAFREFLRLGQAVWLLHKLAFVCDPTAAIFGVPRNSAYDPEYMQQRSVEATDNSECDDAPDQLCVDFMALPGFTLRNSIIKAEVYLKRRPPSA